MEIGEVIVELEKLLGPWYRILEDSEVSFELDLSPVVFGTGLTKGEASLSGEERLRRLKQSGVSRLGARTFFTLMRNENLIPESWKEVGGSPRFIYFDGTVLERSNGDRCVLFMFWMNGRWTWSVRWLNNRCNELDCSAIVTK